MEPVIVGILGIIVLLIFMALRLPIFLSFCLVGLIGAVYLANLGAAINTFALVPYAQAAHYELITIPMFVLMGEFVYYSGISGELFGAVRKWIGHLRGGLGMATIGACAGFAAACGSSVASAATMGTIALPEMKKYKYDNRLATGSVAAGGTLGILIPPSTGFILYGVLTEQSIGRLFIAGIIPGIVLAFLMILVIYFKVRRNPGLAAPAPKANWEERFSALKGLALVLALFLLVIGGIYGGIFTPVEAGGVGAFGAFVIALARRKLSRESLTHALVETMHTSCMIFAIIIGAVIFNYFMCVSRLPMELSGLVSGLPISRYGILAIILLMHVILGCFMDALAMIILTIPIVFPAVMALGFDPIWFGVIIVILIETALITPPVGMNVYVLSGVAPDVTLEDIFRGVFPFLISLIVCIGILIALPELATFLPNLMS